MKLFNFSLFSLLVFISCNSQVNTPKAETEEVKISKTETLNNDTIPQLMNEDDFWKIMEESIVPSANSYKRQMVFLQQILWKLDEKEIVKFDNRFTELLDSSYDYKLWGASFVINGGCSDDCFDHFREYLISRGRDKFYATLKDPESCVSWIKSENEENWEGIRYAASNVYKQKTKKDIPQIYHPKFEIKGKPFNEETVYKQYPKLAKKFRK